MKICFSDCVLPEKLGKSIFLAGPTPRKKTVKSWRPRACQILEEIGFDGNVLVPEWSPNNADRKFDYQDQVEWEFCGLQNCSVIVFWIPRKMPDMKAATTNVEFGTYIRDKRVVYGRPDWAEEVRYLDWLYNKFRKETPYSNLHELLEVAVDKADEYEKKAGYMR